MLIEQHETNSTQLAVYNCRALGQQLLHRPWRLNPQQSTQSFTMKVWLHDESDAHPTAPHDSTNEPVSLDELKTIGVLGFVNQSLDDVNKIASDRGYVARDEVCSLSSYSSLFLCFGCLPLTLLYRFSYLLMAPPTLTELEHPRLTSFINIIIWLALHADQRHKARLR